MQINFSERTIFFVLANNLIGLFLKPIFAAKKTKKGVKCSKYLPVVLTFTSVVLNLIVALLDHGLLGEALVHGLACAGVSIFGYDVVTCVFEKGVSVGTEEEK